MAVKKRKFKVAVQDDTWVKGYIKVMEFLEKGDSELKCDETENKGKKVKRVVSVKSEDIPHGKMEWYRTKRSSGLLEFTCVHGVGHPDYNSAALIAGKYKHPVSVWLTHGCDGCCSRNDFPGHKPKVRRK